MSVILFDHHSMCVVVYICINWFTVCNIVQQSIIMRCLSSSLQLQSSKLYHIISYYIADITVYYGILYLTTVYYDVMKLFCYDVINYDTVVIESSTSINTHYPFGIYLPST